MNAIEPLLVETIGGSSLKYGELWIHSRYDPLDGPSRLVASLEARAETLYLIPSPGLGYGIPELIEKLPGTSAILCVEAVASLLHVAATALAPTLAAHPGRIGMATPATATGAMETLGRFRRIVEMRLSGGRNLASAAYDATLSALDARVAGFWRNRLTLMRMGRLWTRNVFANLAWMPVRRLSPAIACDDPVLVCGAGPSLEQCLDWVKSRRDRMRILAADTAVSTLLAAGISVDGIVCLEGQAHNLADFTPLARRPVRLFADLTAHPSTFRATSGPVELVASAFADGEFVRRLSGAGLGARAVPPLGSVGVLALDIARNLGKGPLFVTGLDFSFPAGKTHARSSPGPVAEARRETRCVKPVAAWNALIREGVRECAPGLYSDPALQTYATLARDELARAVSGREPGLVLDIRRTGLPLGIPRAAFKEADRLLGGALEAGGSAWTQGDDPGDAYGNAASPFGERARDFLRAESARLSLLYDCMKGRARVDREGLTAILKSCDYLYYHFPDPERVLALEQDALRRTLVELTYWLPRLESTVVSTGIGSDASSLY